MKGFRLGMISIIIMLLSVFSWCGSETFAAGELRTALDACVSESGKKISLELSLSYSGGLGAVSGSVSYDRERLKLSSADNSDSEKFFTYDDDGGKISFICMSRDKDTEEQITFMFRPVGEKKGKYVFSFNTVQSLDYEGNEISGSDCSTVLEIADNSTEDNSQSSSAKQKEKEKNASGSVSSSGKASEKEKTSGRRSSEKSSGVIRENESKAGISDAEEASPSEEEISAGLADKDKAAAAAFPVGTVFGIAVGFALSAGAALLIMSLRRRK